MEETVRKLESLLRRAKGQSWKFDSDIKSMRLTLVQTYFADLAVILVVIIVALK